MKWEKRTDFGHSHSGVARNTVTMDMPPWMLRSVIVFFLLLGTALCGACAYFVMKQLDYMKTAVKANAVIVDMVEDTGDIGEDDTVYRPILELKDVSGQTHTIRSTVGYSRGQQRIGDVVEMLYPPGEPEKAEQNSLIANWWSLILGVLGLGFLASAALGRWLANRA